MIVFINAIENLLKKEFLQRSFKQGYSIQDFLICGGKWL